MGGSFAGGGLAPVAWRLRRNWRQAALTKLAAPVSPAAQTPKPSWLRRFGSGALRHGGSGALGFGMAAVPGHMMYQGLKQRTENIAGTAAATGAGGAMAQFANLPWQQRLAFLMAPTMSVEKGMTGLDPRIQAAYNSYRQINPKDPEAWARQHIQAQAQA